ncbi:MAG: hypothetical protein QOD00_2887 [Blastocatellia bacterium]|jgi:hypothetical protein|nr:hypothetical protein [Blastocatellia bacterium]
MSKQLDDAQTLTQYLLGSLSAAESERLDELSVTDDRVAEALKSVENDLIDAYVQDELDEAACAQFKTYYLASATRRERVAFAQAFQAQAEKRLTAQATKAQVKTPTEARMEAATEVEPGRKGRGIFSAWRGFNVSRPAWQWGAACAALALLIVSGWLIFDNARLRQQRAQTEARRDAQRQQTQERQKELTSQSAGSAQLADERADEHADERTRAERERLAQEQAERDQQRIVEQQRAAVQKSSSSNAGASRIASFILAPQMRGASQIQTISILTRTDHVVMRLRLEPNEFTTYRVTLLDETGSQILWRSSPLKARAVADGKTLSLNLRAGLLKPQIVYVLRVTNDAGEIIDDYPFRVVK